MTPGSRAHMIHGQPARAEVKLPPVAAAEKALAEHEATCPGTHQQCYGKPAMEKARLRWIERKDHLKAMLAMAREAERSGWRDAKGRKVEKPITWSKESAPPKTASDKAREMREYRARKAEGQAKPSPTEGHGLKGRPARPRSGYARPERRRNQLRRLRFLGIGHKNPTPARFTGRRAGK